MDYGFHAPTVSRPVPGTMMIEPTESESKKSLDLFCEVMHKIKQEVDAITDDNNPVKNAPHTLEMIVDDWPFPYSRNTAVFPTDFVKNKKILADCQRINEVHGDRNLICSCASIEEYEEKEN